MKLYEAMILVTTTEASRDWDGIARHVTDILTRNGAEAVDLRKWGERKLAYEINHQRKATYILAHFQATTNVIAEIRRELQLSERILRHLILADKDGLEVRLLSDLEEEEERVGTRAAKATGRPTKAAGEERATTSDAGPEQPRVEATEQESSSAPTAAVAPQPETKGPQPTDSAEVT